MYPSPNINNYQLMANFFVYIPYLQMILKQIPEFVLLFVSILECISKR